MSFVTPIFAVQNTEQQHGNVDTFQSASCETAALANGVSYLVIYRANTYGSNANVVSFARLMLGGTSGTIIAECGAEGIGTSATQLQGFALVTGDGTSTLDFYYAPNQTGNGRISAMSIVAVPLSDFGTQNTDWFQSGSNAATEEVSNASDTDTTAKTVNFTLPGTSEDWLVLMSVESRAESGSNQNRVFVRFEIDSSLVNGFEQSKEAEDVRDWNGFTLSKLVTLSGGSHTFRIGVRNGAPNALVDARRSNIWVIRKSHWQQILQTLETTGASTASSTYSTLCSRAITPSETGYVLLLGNVVAFADTANNHPHVRIHDGTSALVTDATDYSNSVETGGNGYPSANADMRAFSMPFAQSISGATTYSLDYANPVGTGLTYAGRDGRTNLANGIETSLIVWELKTAQVGQDFSRSVSESLQISESISRLLARSLALDETLHASESLSVSRAVSRSLTEGLEASETLDHARQLHRIVDEICQHVESISQARGMSYAISEALSIAETLSQSIGRALSVSEALSLAETISRSLSISRSRSEQSSILESIARARSVARAVSETAAFQESSSSSRSLVRLRSEALEMSESSTFARGIAFAVDELLSIVETIGTGFNVAVLALRAVAYAFSPLRSVANAFESLRAAPKTLEDEE